MTVLDLIRTRTSVRKYGPRPVPRGVLDRCLEAARLAPSACNSQPWSFVVVDDKALRQRVAAKAFSGLFSMNAFARDAAALIVVLRHRSRYAARLGGLLRSTEFSLIDIGVACQHFVLQAQAEGLGTCWIGWFNEKAVKHELELPNHVKVDVMLSVGYAADSSNGEKERRSLGQIRTFNRQPPV
jgi:nitroreductase